MSKETIQEELGWRISDARADFEALTIELVRYMEREGRVFADGEKKAAKKIRKKVIINENV
jgi:hypothetical protein